MQFKKEFIGESLGTYILVLFGCGAAAVSFLFGAYQGIFQIALVWGCRSNVSYIFNASAFLCSP